MNLTWKQRLAKARKRGGFTEEDMRLARDFNTCAISERVDYEFLDNSEAYDVLTPKASNLGSAFYHLICGDNIKEASKVYKDIQKIKKFFVGDIRCPQY